ncbi:MAG TPA: plastocyanin, partial [Rhizobacter sp.]|nr:plastocyanin [Rhizobacter sp.]
SMNKNTLALMALTLGTGFVHAGTVQLTVTDKDGKPTPDVVVLVQQPAKTAPSPAPKPVVIVQEGSRFVPFLTVVPVGSTLHFINKDDYDHHVRSTPSGPLGSIAPAKSFELRLDANLAAGSRSNDVYANTPAKKNSGTSTGDVRVDAAGAIGLGCHLHGSMRGQVYVADTPWFAKTDANGVASIEGVPDGVAQITLWHPDQLQDQAPVPIQVNATPLTTTTQLNFVPKRRRG